MAEGGDGVFTREAHLAPDFVPPSLPGREAHLRELASLLQPAARGQKPASAFLHGPPGTGKTATARYVLRQLEEASSRALPVYVNCWQESTRLAVLSRIAVALRLPLPRRGLAEDEVLSRVMESLRRDQRVLLAVLDEVDRLEGRDRVLYDLSRAAEVHRVPAGTIAVSNDPTVLARLDGRVRSSLAARSLEFRAYSPPELKAILAERAKLAFRPGAVAPEAIAVAAAIAARSGGDARLALELLLRAGRHADEHGASQVGAAEVRAASEPFKARAAVELPAELGRGEELMLKVLKAMPGARKGGVEAALAYGEYSRESDESERGVRGHLALLERRGLVETWSERGQRFVKLKRTS
jgi:cell division control protein 6